MKMHKQYDTSKWEKAFTNANGQLEIAIDSYLILGDKSDYYFEFEGTTIRWVNGTPEIAALIIIPIKDGNNYLTEQELARRFLSQLCYQMETGISELGFIGSGNVRIDPFYTHPYHYGGMLVHNPRFTQIGNLSSKQKKALALFREATSANSGQYKFLVFYKIIEIANERKKPDEWINSHLDPQRIYRLAEWKMFIPENKTPGQFLREAQRNAIAHVDEVLKSGDPTIDPDDLAQRSQIEDSIGIISQLAKIAMKEILPAK